MCYESSLIPQALQADILAHKDQLVRLEEKASQVKDGVPKSRTSELRSRYTSLADNCRVCALAFSKFSNICSQDFVETSNLRNDDMNTLL